MQPDKLKKLILSGHSQHAKAGEVVYSLDFDERLYMVSKGYILRYLVTKTNTRSIQAIYGPGYFFPLSPMFRRLLGYELSEEGATYLYEALTNVEINYIANATLVNAIHKDPYLYADLLFEAGRRLQSNIHRLENYALKSDYKKIAHHLVYLALEFGDSTIKGVKTTVELRVPTNAQLLGEQLNLSVADAGEHLQRLVQEGFVTLKDDHLRILDLDMLKDVYL